MASPFFGWTKTEDRVRNLNDLRHFTNLRSLEIWNASGISNFATLEVDTLRYLYVYGARSPDFSGISTLSALQNSRSFGLFSTRILIFLFQPTSPNFFSYPGSELSRSYQRIEQFPQIQSLKNLVEGNRKTKIESGLYVEDNGRGKLHLDAVSFIMMEPWSTEPAVEYDGQIPKAAQNLDLEISRVDKMLLENPNDPWPTFFKGSIFFLTLRNQIRSTDSRNSLFYLGVEPNSVIHLGRRLHCR